ncbi:unnamed protein product [Coccothraustes coccothraustes]
MFCDWKGTVPDVFERCTKNASYVRLRSSRLSNGRDVRLPEAKKRLLRALGIVPVAVLSKARVLPKAARDRRLASGSSRLAKKRLLRALSIVPVAVLSKVRVLLKAARDRRLASGSFRLAKKRLLRALSIVPVAVLSKVRVLLKAACDRRLASGSSRLVCSASLSASIFAESFSTLSHKEKLC